MAAAETGEGSLEQLLAKVTLGPAPPQFHHVPPQLELRYAALLRDLMSQHADAEIDAAKRKSFEAEVQARSASMMLWAFTAAVLFLPAEEQDKDAVSRAHDFAVVDVVRKRLQLAET
eukprot:9898885-Karenia_brevis.AAC.1